MKRRIFSCLGIVALVISGCRIAPEREFPPATHTTTYATRVQTTLQPTEPEGISIPPTQTPLLIPSDTAFPSPTLMKTPTIVTLTPNWTPLPTLASPEVKNLVAQLLATNGDCALPCWWGITPGETQGGVAVQFLRSFAEEIFQFRGAKSETTYGYIYPLPEIKNPGYLEIHVSGGIVSKIIASSEGRATLFQLDRLLVEYGEPSKVLLFYGWMGEVGILQLDLLLFYPDAGFLAFYAIESQQVNDVYRSCPQGVGPDLRLWAPLDQVELADIFGSIKRFKSLEEATGLDIATFYQVFSDPASQACLEAPAR